MGECHADDPGVRLLPQGDAAAPRGRAARVRVEDHRIRHVEVDQLAHQDAAEAAAAVRGRGHVAVGENGAPDLHPGAVLRDRAGLDDRTIPIGAVGVAARQDAAAGRRRGLAPPLEQRLGDHQPGIRPVDRPEVGRAVGEVRGDHGDGAAAGARVGLEDRAVDLDVGPVAVHRAADVRPVAREEGAVHPQNRQVLGVDRAAAGRRGVDAAGIGHRLIAGEGRAGHEDIGAAVPVADGIDGAPRPASLVPLKADAGDVQGAVDHHDRAAEGVGVMARQVGPVAGELAPLEDDRRVAHDHGAAAERRGVPPERAVHERGARSRQGLDRPAAGHQPAGAVVQEGAAAEQGLGGGEGHTARSAGVRTVAVLESETLEGHPLAAGAVRVGEAQETAAAAAVDRDRGARRGADGEPLAGVVDGEAVGRRRIGPRRHLDHAAVRDPADRYFERLGVLRHPDQPVARGGMEHGAGQSGDPDEERDEGS
jgi:hypothetical protein